MGVWLGASHISSIFLKLLPFFCMGWIWSYEGRFQVHRTVSCFWCLSVCGGRGVVFGVSGPRFLDFSGLGPCLYPFSGPTDRFLFLVFVCLWGFRGWFWGLGTPIFGFLGSWTLSLPIFRSNGPFPVFGVCLSVGVEGLVLGSRDPDFWVSRVGKLTHTKFG